MQEQYIREEGITQIILERLYKRVYLTYSKSVHDTGINSVGVGGVSLSIANMQAVE